MAQAQPILNASLKLLVIEDSEDDALLLVGCFKRAGHSLEFQRVDNASATRQALLGGRWDAILSDHSMPGFNALSALALMQELNLDLPFIIVSGVIDEETAIAAMRAGAHDYLSKDHLDRLVPAVEREIREATNRAEHRAALAAVQENEARFRSLVSNIPGMAFQLLQTQEGGLRFLYVSEGSAALLGLSPTELTASPQLFFDAVHSEDRSSIETALSLSAAKLIASELGWPHPQH